MILVRMYSGFCALSPGTVRCCGKTFSRSGSFRYHVEKDHMKVVDFVLASKANKDKQLL